MAASDTRKKKIWIVVLVIVVAVVLIVSGVVVWKLQQTNAASASEPKDTASTSPTTAAAVLERLYRVTQLQNVSGADMLAEITAILAVQLGKKPVARAVHIDTSQNKTVTFDKHEPPMAIIQQDPGPPVSIVVHDYGDDQSGAGDDW